MNLYEFMPTIKVQQYSIYLCTHPLEVRIHPYNESLLQWKHNNVNVLATYSSVHKEPINYIRDYINYSTLFIMFSHGGVINF